MFDRKRFYEENKNIEERLNQTTFLGCEGVLVGDVLRHCDFPSSKFDLFKFIVKIFREMFLFAYEYEIAGNPKTIFLFTSPFRNRKDHLSAIHKVVSTTDNYILYTAKNKYKLSLPIIKINLIVSWMKTFKTLKIDKLMALCFTACLYRAYCDWNRITGFCKKKKWLIKNIVSYCDFVTIDSFFIQKSNYCNLNTFTLQHGIYAENSFAYSHSHSKKFLVNSLLSYNRAIKSGMDKERLAIVGAPQNINSIYPCSMQKNNNGVLGVYFSGIGCVDEDIELLNFSKEIAKKYNFSIIVKFHPGFGIENYSADLFKNVKATFCEEISSEQFANMAEVLIDNGSTVFVENMLKRRFELTFINSSNPYNDDNIKLTIRDLSQFDDIYKLYSERVSEIEKMFDENIDYLCTTQNPFFLYKKYFDLQC